MRTNPSSQDKCLGEIHTRIAGMQFVDGEVQAGEIVYLERDFQNQHDRNAIRVKNLDTISAGFVPREICSWLSPLWDEGKVFLEGQIPKEGYSSNYDRHQGCSLHIRVFLTPKGNPLLQRNPNPDTEMEAVQDILRQVYENLQTYTNPGIINGLYERLKKFVQRDALPETHLLLSLFPNVASSLQKSRSIANQTTIQDYLRQLKVLDGIHYRNLTIFPIQTSKQSSGDYILLSQALQSKSVEIQEVSDQGHVHEILFKNKTSLPLLIPEGEILTGAKQNRVINITILIAAQCQIKIPVSCVERGRWQYSSKHFESSQYAHPSLRSKKIFSSNMSRVQSGEARSDQSEVWDEVSAKLHEMHASSSTDSLLDGFKASSEKIQDYQGHFVLPDNTNGIIVCCGDKVIGIDFFSKAKHFKESWSKLSSSYFVHACFDSKESKKTEKEKATHFMESIIESIDVCAKSIGLGEEFMVKGNNITGTGVWYLDSVCHLSAFSVNNQNQRKDPIPDVPIYM